MTARQKPQVGEVVKITVLHGEVFREDIPLPAYAILCASGCNTDRYIHKKTYFDPILETNTYYGWTLWSVKILTACKAETFRTISHCLAFKYKKLPKALQEKILLQEKESTP